MRTLGWIITVTLLVVVVFLAWLLFIGTAWTHGGFPGAARLRIYERSPARAIPIGYQVEDASGFTWTPIQNAVGCRGVGEPWTIRIGPYEPDRPVAELMPLLSSADVDNPLDAEIWIDVADDGSVTWGEGMPDWAEGPAPQCEIRGYQLDRGPIGTGSPAIPARLV
jgi:hypothetical protein